MCFLRCRRERADTRGDRSRRGHAADTAALGIDVYVAGVLETVEDAARQDERARRVAIDHQLWVAVASFAGSTGGGYSRAAGRSAIWGPDGALIIQAGPETGAIA